MTDTTHKGTGIDIPWCIDHAKANAESSRKAASAHQADAELSLRLAEEAAVRAALWEEVAQKLAREGQVP